MLRLLKHGAYTALKRFGYALVREEQYRRALDELSLSHTMRSVHVRDAVEMEAMYRRFVFSDLPQNEQRAGLLYNLIGTTMGEGIYVAQNLNKALQVPGDVCEFGVAQGATSQLIANEIMASSQNLWLFDSFEGLPEPTAEDRLIHDIFKLGSMSRYKGTMASPESEVRNKLASINFPVARTKIKKGWIKDTLMSVDLPSQIAFAYVDFDFYEPIKDALEFIEGRMPVGGRVIVDDYGYFSEGAQLAVDRFVERTAGRFTFELPLPFAGHFCILRKVS